MSEQLCGYLCFLSGVNPQWRHICLKGNSLLRPIHLMQRSVLKNTLNLCCLLIFSPFFYSIGISSSSDIEKAPIAFFENDFFSRPFKNCDKFRVSFQEV